MRFFHGSYDKLPVGFVMQGRGEQFEKDWDCLEPSKYLEKYRPEGMIAHRDAVFMADNPESLDALGAENEFIFELEVQGKDITRHDLNWSSHIDILLEKEMTPELENQIADAALAYWNGEPFSSEPLWETCRV